MIKRGRERMGKIWKDLKPNGDVAAEVLMFEFTSMCSITSMYINVLVGFISN